MVILGGAVVAESPMFADRRIIIKDLRPTNLRKQLPSRGLMVACLPTLPGPL